MAGRKKTEVNADAEMDMTPIIDVVFNLVIFFMLTANMAQTQVAKLELPAANEADTTSEADPTRLIVNVLKSGVVEIAGQNMSDNEGELRKLLKAEADQKRDPANPKFSEKALLVRVDSNCKYDDVQRFMQLCTEFGIYKLEFAALKLAE